jgi:hypothetical protein
MRNFRHNAHLDRQCLLPFARMRALVACLMLALSVDVLRHEDSRLRFASALSTKPFYAMA